MSPRFSLLLALGAVTLLTVGCASGRRVGAECTSSADCGRDRCVEGMCVAGSPDSGVVMMSDGGGPGEDSGAPGDGGGALDSGPPPPMCTASAECDDANMCTTDDCAGGTCSRTPIACDDGDACTDDACDPATGCATTITSCDDANVCTADACDSVTGCSHAMTAVMGGSCATPINISAGGTFTADSTCASNDFTGVCLGATGPDIAFVLDLTAQSDVSLDARGTAFSSVLFVGSTCGTGATACDSDGTPLLMVRLPAGRHFVGLDGRASTEVGAVSLVVTITPVVVDELLTFPIATDTHYSLYGGGYYWNAGDYIQGVRSTGLSSITGADLTLRILTNGLTCGNQNMQLRINGTIVGPVLITPGLMTFTRSYTFGAITGPSYTIRLETTSTVTSGCGAAAIGDGTSTLRIRR